MEVRPSGAVTFYVRYCDARHRQREMRIGRLGDVTVELARRRAKEVRAQAALGSDPAGKLDRLRAVPTFSQFIEQRYLPFVKDRLRSFADHEGFYRLRLKGMWGDRALDEINPLDVANLQDRLRQGGLSAATSNRYVAFVRRVFNLALQWNAYEGQNPAKHAVMPREHNRERYLDQVELRAFFCALSQDPNQSAANAMALLVMTGARLGEALAARWEHLDFHRKRWTVPLSKSGRRRHIPLSEPAVAILMRQRRMSEGDYVFPGKEPGTRLGHPSRAWRRVKAAAGLEPSLRLHDLRHTFASTLINQGVSLHTVGTILGHSQSNMTQRYAHLAPSRLLEAANMAIPDDLGMTLLMGQ